MLSDVHCICPKGFYVATISANVETENSEKELQIAFDLIGPVLEKFTTVFLIFLKDGVIKNKFDFEDFRYVCSFFR